MPCCELCMREVVETSEHHLIPKTRHKNRKNKKSFDREEVKVVVDLCQPCHSQIHNLFTEKELERSFNTIDLLKSEERMSKFLVWISKKSGTLRTKNKRETNR